MISHSKGVVRIGGLYALVGKGQGGRRKGCYEKNK